MKKIILITGGERSGKSEYAEKLALSLSANPIYLATAHIWDDDFAQRVELHRQRRGPEWTTVEEEVEISRVNVEGRVVLIDCVTLWCTNVFFENQAIVQQSLDFLKDEFDRFTLQDATFIFVTNEIGMGGVPSNELQRKFTDLQGWMNQYIGSHADEIELMVCGRPLKVC